MKMIFFSDAHLKKKSHDRTSYLLRFIDDVCMDADAIYVLGDLFEFYHGYENYLYPWYIDILNSFKMLTQAGKRLHFIEGNHEFNMGRYFEIYTGGSYSEHLTINVDEKRVFLSHGYEINRDLLLMLLKTPFVNAVMDIFGPSLTWRIAEIASIFFSKKNKVFKGEKRLYFRDTYRRYAVKKLEEGFDAVILAHSHISDIMAYHDGDKQRYYLNTGDIIEEHTYVEYMSTSGFQLKRYGQI